MGLDGHQKLNQQGERNDVNFLFDVNGFAWSPFPASTFLGIHRKEFLSVLSENFTYSTPIQPLQNLNDRNNSMLGVGMPIAAILTENKINCLIAIGTIVPMSA